MDINKIYYGDALDLTCLLPDNFINLVCTSPPYCNSKSYGNGVNVLHPDHYNDWIIPIIKEINRSLTIDGSFILNINDKIIKGVRHPYVFELVCRIISETGMKLYDRYVWHKKSAMPTSGNRLNDRMEFIFHFIKSNKMKSNIDNIRVPYSKNTLTRYKSPVYYNEKIDEYGITSKGDRKMQTINSLGTKPTTVMTFHTAGILKGGTAGKHPSPFHPELPEFFVKWLTDENDIVLDPFVGGGTVPFVCKNNNRNYIGFELNKNYKKLIDEKLSILV